MEDYRDALKGLDFRPYLAKSDALAWRAVATSYGLIILAFVIPALWPSPASLIVSLVLLGNRQLALGIMMHDCVHGAFFKTHKLNKWVGEALCAAPILAQYEGYRRYHLKHHAKAGTTDDPDYPNYQLYPVSKKSLLRKILRDFFFVTGLKNAYILLLMHAGMLEYDMSYQTSEADKRPGAMAVVMNLFTNLRLAILFHTLLVIVLVAFGVGSLYLLWWLAYFTTFMFFSRIRNAAEHANVPDLLDKDPRLHARTVYANWWEKLTFAPNDVNYHLEHHWLPSVPPYRLAEFHQFLQQAGVLHATPILSGYPQVFKALIKD